jgi:hypothetical protein
VPQARDERNPNVGCPLDRVGNRSVHDGCVRANTDVVPVDVDEALVTVPVKVGLADNATLPVPVTLYDVPHAEPVEFGMPAPG